MADDARARLREVFARDDALAEAVDRLLAEDRPAVLAALAAEIEQDRDASSDEADRRLVRIAAVLSDLEGRDAVDVALRLLDARSPTVRVAAGEAILDIAIDGADAVLDAAEAAVDRTDAPRAMRELPYLLAEIGHGRTARALVRLLRHEDPSVVAAAIDALVLVGDPAVVPALRKLFGDERAASIVDEEGEGPVPLAALASEAVEALRGADRPRGRRR